VLRYRISLQQKQYDFFDINVRNGEIILKPVRVNASELLTSVRRKVKRLEVSEQDVEAAIRWARKR